MTCKQCKNMGECEDDAFANGAKFDPDESAKYCAGFEPITTADRIRAMSDEELTDAIYRLIHANDPALWFCKGTKECGELMDNDEEIPEEMCQKCLLEKLQQPAEEG